MSIHDPSPVDRFTFGLWTVGNPGRDPFGDPVRAAIDPCRIVAELARCGAWGVNLHDDDLVPFGSDAAARDRIVDEFRTALEDHGMRVPMATCNLFTHPVFKDGAFTANDPRVREYALAKSMRAIDLGAELGARTYVMWGGREGTEADACRDPQAALRRMRRAVDYLCEYVVDRGYDLRIALEAKPNEPRGDTYLATTGHMLHFIATLEHESMVGVNPEVAHETMAGLSMTHGVAQAMEAGKLFHIDLNSQRVGRYDQDLRFGSEDLKQCFLLVRLLEGTAGNEPYDGPRHFDAHAYRTEDEGGVWDFARGCMATYRALRERARAFDADAEVRDILAETVEEDRATDGFTSEGARALRDAEFDLDGIAARGLRYERLDQLLTEHLMGVR